MKRITYAVAFVLSLLLSVSLSVSALAAPLLLTAELVRQDASEKKGYEEALAAAQEQWDAFYEEIKDDYNPYVTSALLSIDWEGKKEEAWFFCFGYYEPDKADFEVIILTSTNQVVVAEEYMRLERQLEWEAEKNELSHFWDLSDKELFYALYMIDPTPKPNRAAIPGDGDLTEQEALAIAKEALIARGISPDSIDNARVSVNFWFFPADNDVAWMLVYYEPDNAQDINANVYQVNLRKDGTPFMVYDLYQDGQSHG